MTPQRAHAALAASVEELWSAVGELVLIVLEDQPSDSDGLAAADALVERVGELQGEVAAARDALVPVPSEVDLERAASRALAEFGGHLHAAVWQYWAQLRAYEPTAQLRAATRRAGGEWIGWRRSVEETAAVCEARFDHVVSTLRSVVGPPYPSGPTTKAEFLGPIHTSANLPALHRRTS